MKHGKETCRILKDIRQQIATANGIEYAVEECQYRGACPGTCPKCEADVRYLEQQLARNHAQGKPVSFVGISLSVAALSTSIIGCGNSQIVDSRKTIQEVLESIDSITYPVPEAPQSIDSIVYKVGPDGENPELCAPRITPRLNSSTPEEDPFLGMGDMDGLMTISKDSL